MKLTAAKVRTARIPPGKPELLLNDGNGLYLRVRPHSKTWIIRRKHLDRMTVQTVGTYPEISLQEARLAAAEQRVKAGASTRTVRTLVEKYRVEVIAHHKRPEMVNGYADRAILPALGHRKVRDVTRADLVNLIQGYAKRGPRTADALRGTLRALFGYAVELGYRDDNPCSEITPRVSGYKARPRERVLSDAEISQVMRSQHANSRLLRFLLLTGLRISEAQHGHQDGDYWIVPAELSKNGRPHWTFLTDTAKQQLPLPTCTPTNIQAWLRRRCAKFGIDPAFTPHDLRRTFATRLHDAGELPHVVERCLNHTLQGVMATYNRAEYRAERTAAYKRMEQLVLAHG